MCSNWSATALVLEHPRGFSLKICVLQKSAIKRDMMNTRTLAIIAVCLLMPVFACGVAYSGETLSKSSFVGCWRQSAPITQYERTTFVVKGDFAVSLRREFDDGKTIVATGQAEFHGDLMLADMLVPDSDHNLVLVGGGWNVGGIQKLFGTLYLYSGSYLFNGLPFQLVKQDCVIE